MGPGSGSELYRWQDKVTLNDIITSNCWYRADNVHDLKWSPSIHMPRWASRTGIDVDFIGPFSGLWELIHGDGAWERNDFVFALTFKRVDE